MSDKTDIWFPFYIGDYLKDTTKLTPERHGIYLLLILTYWQEGPLSDDMDELSMITKTNADSKSLAYVLDNFFEHKNDKYIQKRIDKERKEAKANKKKRAERAKKAAEARWNSNNSNDAISNATSIQQALHNECPSSSPSPSSLSTHPKSPTKSKNIFVAPKIDDIKKYCLERENNVDPEKFYDFYSAKGWMIGKNKMRDWKAAVRTWEKNNLQSKDSKKTKNRIGWDNDEPINF